jgi:hypothetical protein
MIMPLNNSINSNFYSLHNFQLVKITPDTKDFSDDKF